MPWTDAKHAADALAVSRECDLEEWKEEPLRTALLMSGMLDGFPRYAKMHPCGVVLSRDPIRNLTPLFTSAKGWPTTHFDMDAVEAVGLIKLDILAQGGIAVLRDAQTALGRQGVSVDLKSLEIGGLGGSESPPGPDSVEAWSDEAVWEIIASGNARGVHHIESPAMTSLACMAAVRDIDRFIAIVSVIRPGAANGLKKSQFARRAQGLEPVDYTHESLSGVLRSTFGVVAYEEHILQICEAFAGLAPGRADMLRRALVKLDMRKVAELKVEFVAAAKAKSHHDEIIEKVWQLVTGFQGYAFCRAHSTAYRVEAYQGAYLKCYHPTEFMAAVLSNGKGFYSPLVYTLECRRLGIGFLSPDVNVSTDSFDVELITVESGTPARNLGRAIRVPMRSIKGLSESLLERWRAEKLRSAFLGVRDFCERVRPEPAETLSIIRVGALDGFGMPRTEQFWHCLHTSRDGRVGDGWLFQNCKDQELRTTFREEPSRLQRLCDEFELLGYTITGHPLERFPEVGWGTYCRIADLHRYHRQRVTVCGLIIVTRSHIQANGEPMKFISICDQSGILECEILAEAYRYHGLANVIEVTGEVQPFDNGAGYTLEVLRVQKPRVSKR